MRFGRLIWRNLTRNKLRTSFTGAAVALAVALVCVLLTMPDGFKQLMASASQGTRIGVHAKAGLVYTIPYAYLQKVKAMPGVVNAISYDWFGGAVDVDEGVTFASFSVDADPVGSVFEDYQIDAQALDGFRRNRDGALVAREIMDRYKWSIGDRVTLESTRFGFPLDFRVVGVLELPSNTGQPEFWFNREYLVQTLEGRGMAADEMSMLWARVDDAAAAQALMSKIDEYFATSDVQTSSETEQGFALNFFSALQGLLTIIMVVTGVVALCIVFVAANTASMSVRERGRELAILKALGFSRRSIFGTLLAEAVLLSTIAGVLGAALSVGLAAYVRDAEDWGRQLGPLASFSVGPWVLVQGVFLALFVGMLSGVVPSFGAARRSVVSALREVF